MGERQSLSNDFDTSASAKKTERRRNRSSRLEMAERRAEKGLMQIMGSNMDDKSLQFKMLNGKRSQPPMSEAEIKEQ